MRVPSLLAWLVLVGLPSSSASQAPSPVAAAFGQQARNTQERVLLLAEAMPADGYLFRATPQEPTFAQVLVELRNANLYACSLLSGVDRPDSPDLFSGSPKDAIVSGLLGSQRFCGSQLSLLRDSALAESVALDMRPQFGPPLPPVSIAEALMVMTAYWTDVHARLAGYFRLYGLVPPKPCGNGGPENNCGSGRSMCFSTTASRGGPGFRFELSDAPYSVTSDGLGPYSYGTSNVVVTGASLAAVMQLGSTSADGSQARSIRVDLDHPVPGDIGAPLGLIVDNHDVEVGAQWYADPEVVAGVATGRRLAHSVLDIPVGTHVTAELIAVQLHIDGVHHSLQMGRQPGGHCFSDGTAMFGTGTSLGTIFRADSTTWVVDLPAGSVGRLFDDHLSHPNAVNRGLYYVSLHFVLRAPSD